MEKFGCFAVAGYAADVFSNLIFVKQRDEWFGEQERNYECDGAGAKDHCQVPNCFCNWEHKF